MPESRIAEVQQLQQSLEIYLDSLRIIQPFVPTRAVNEVITMLQLRHDRARMLVNPLQARSEMRCAPISGCEDRHLNVVLIGVVFHIATVSTNGRLSTYEPLKELEQIAASFNGLAEYTTPTSMVVSFGINSKNVGGSSTEVITAACRCALTMREVLKKINYIERRSTHDGDDEDAMSDSDSQSTLIRSSTESLPYAIAVSAFQTQCDWVGEDFTSKLLISTQPCIQHIMDLAHFGLTLLQAEVVATEEVLASKADMKPVAFLPIDRIYRDDAYLGVYELRRALPPFPNRSKAQVKLKDAAVASLKAGWETITGSGDYCYVAESSTRAMSALSNYPCNDSQGVLEDLELYEDYRCGLFHLRRLVDICQNAIASKMPPRYARQVHPQWEQNDGKLLER